MDRLLDATARAEERHFWFRGFRRFVRPLVATAAAEAASPCILDCGCGTGHNLSWLRQYGHAVGIDLTWTGIACATRRGDRLVAQASATALPFGDGIFDIVTSFDVIYALEDRDETAAIGEMRRVLRPGGHLVINVAALELLRGNHSVLAAERRRYSRATLGKKLADAGFEVRRMTYTNATILPLVAGVRLAQRLSGDEDPDTEISVPPAPVNAALSALLAAESVVVRWVNMPVGSSLMALAKRR